MSREICLPRSLGSIEEKSTSAGVRDSTILLFSLLFDNWLTRLARSFMTENIMPLSQAVEGYDLFNAMKVQKVVFEADK